MNTYRTLAVALIGALPVFMNACGGDDDAPPDTSGGSSGKGGSAGKGGKGGSGGDAGDGTGGTTGGTSDTGGTGGSTGGTGDTGGSGGSTGGSGGTDAGGEGGTAAEAGTGNATGGTGGSTGGTGGTSGNTGCDLSGDGLDREVLPADITDDFTATSDKVWTLDGTVKVHDGATLTIEPCTRIEGTPAPSPGMLAILRGAKIQAAGTANEPILFTTQSAPGERSGGQWGGVVLLGNAPITAAADAKIFEGLTDTSFTYGGTDAADDSGTLQYVRIEFGGWEILPDKEINGLSLAAVGGGTTIDHIMVSNTLDDCFEWWGGTVQANYLICNNPGDDMFDADEGFLGGGTHWFGRRTGVGVVSSGDPNGFEWDGTEAGADLSPKVPSLVAASKVTLCGTGAAVSSGGGNPEFGMVLRELVQGDIDDLALLGFEYGIDTRNAIQTTDVTIDDSAFWGLVNAGAISAPDATDNDSGFDDGSLFTGGTGNTEPNPAPFTLEQCHAEAGPAAEVLDSDVGAFAGDDSWTAGLWVSWDAD
jgi:hypothetical protein